MADAADPLESWQVGPAGALPSTRAVDRDEAPGCGGSVDPSHSRRHAALWDWTAFFHYLVSPYLAVGAAITLGISVASILLGLLFGLIAALMRLSARRYLRLPAAGYIWLMRGTPVLVQLIVIYTGLPQLGLRMNVIEAAIIGLGVNEGAYLAEIFRAGIMAVPVGQSEAARAIGLSRWQTMRLVILPQALRIAIPPLGNAFNGLMKTSSLASVISMDELLRRTEMLIQVQFKVLEIFLVAALYYLAMTTVWGFVQAWLERTLARGTERTDGRARTPLKLSLPAPDAS
jgi:polar amino acid transport system permease protein